ncbi:MAG: pitrilysin family protein, partial [Bacteroidota bacterium]
MQTNAKLNRTLAPKAESLRLGSLPSFQPYELSNGMKVYCLQHGTIEAVQVEAVYKAGASFQEMPGLASYTFRNMLEGTASYSSLELAEELDRFGAWLTPDTGYESSAFTLTSLEKHLESTLPLMREVITQPIFPEEKFEVMRNRGHQQLTVNEQKTGYMARRKYDGLIYGFDHPYGRSLDHEGLDELSLEGLKNYQKTYVYPGNCFLTAVGKFDEEKLVYALDKQLGDLPMDSPVIQESLAQASLAPAEPGRYHLPLAGMQSTVRVGHKGYARSHPDYYRMRLVNTLLGGFFGSRLMKNIREEKGYTYGIYSSWSTHRYHGTFFVQGDVGNEYVEATITEIKKEMNKVRDELV